MGYKKFPVGGLLWKMLDLNSETHRCFLDELMHMAVGAWESWTIYIPRADALH